MEPRANVVPGPGKHSIYIHSPKDRHRDVCLRTKNEGFLQKTCWYSRAQSGNFGDLIAAEKFSVKDVNNHGYSGVVQDLATRWLQPYPRKTKTSQEIQKSLQKFLEPEKKPKVIYTHNS